MHKTCAIHQPNFMPWLGYFYKIATSDVFVILDTVDIVTGTAKAITNRTKIKSTTDTQWLTVPIQKSESKRICDIAMVDNNWRTKILKTVQCNYAKSPHFESFFPILERLIGFESANLAEYNTHLIKEICLILDIHTEIVMASKLNIETEDRNQRIIDICKTLNCDTYYSGKGGTKYHDINLFEKSNIAIKTTNFIHPIYQQQHGVFIEGLSVIDFLFNKQDTQWK